MTFHDGRLAIRVADNRARLQPAGPETEAHGATHLDAMLARHQIDHLVGRFAVDLARIRAFESNQITGDLDHCHVQSVADAEIGNPLLTGVADRGDLPFRTARTESR